MIMIVFVVAVDDLLIYHKSFLILTISSLKCRLNKLPLFAKNLV